MKHSTNGIHSTPANPYYPEAMCMFTSLSVLATRSTYIYLCFLIVTYYKKPRSTLVTRPKLSHASTAAGCNACEDRQRRESRRNLNILTVRVRVRVEVRVRGVVPVPAGTDPSGLE